MNIEQLRSEFYGTGETGGFLFTKIGESEKAYIYSIKVPESIVLHYEVLIRKASPKCLDFVNRIYSETEYKEQYPKASQFGKSAWSYSILSDAESKFRELSDSH